MLSLTEWLGRLESGDRLQAEDHIELLKTLTLHLKNQEVKIVRLERELHRPDDADDFVG